MDFVIAPVIILLVIAAYLTYRAYAGRLRNGGRRDRNVPR